MVFVIDRHLKIFLMITTVCFVLGFLQSESAIQCWRTTLSRPIGVVHVHAGHGAGERPRRRHTAARPRREVCENPTFLFQQVDNDQRSEIRFR